jgi:hypothetical protein
VLIEYNSPNDLGEVLATKQQGKKTIIIREYGIEQFTQALDPTRCRLEVLAGRLPRKIMNLKQADYILKRRKIK